MAEETKIEELETNLIEATSNVSLTQPDTLQKKKKPAKAEKAIEPLEPGIFSLPDSPAAHTVYGLMEAGEKAEELPERRRKVSHSAKWDISFKVEGNKERVCLRMQKGKSFVVIDMDDVNKLLGSNKPAKKLFLLALIIANKQIVHNGVLDQDSISFPLEDLIKLGMYASIRSARNGFNVGADVLTSLKAKGHAEGGSKKHTYSIDALEVLFTGASISRNMCKLYFNPRIDWRFFFQYYTILPSYYFRLSSRASDLLYNVLFLARANARDIEKNGYIDLRFDTAQQYLMLPNETSSPNPQRDIKQPLLDVAAEINKAQIEDYGSDQDFKIEPLCDSSMNVSCFLDTGKYRIHLAGEFAKTIIEQSKKRAAEIEAAAKRNSKIIDNAKAISLAKKMEAEEKAAKEAQASEEGAEDK